MLSIAASEYQDRFFRRNPSLRQPLQLMQAVPNASFFVKDVDCRYVMANAAHLGIYDMPREEDLVGRTGAEFFPDLLAQAYLANDRRVLESGESLQNEIWLVPHVHGLPRWFLSNKSPLFDLEGKVMGLAALMYVIATPEHQRTHFQEHWPDRRRGGVLRPEPLHEAISESNGNDASDVPETLPKESRNRLRKLLIRFFTQGLRFMDSNLLPRGRHRSGGATGHLLQPLQCHILLWLLEPVDVVGG
jgi:hypothetical protein